MLSELSSSLRWKSVGCFFFGRGSTKTSTGCDSSEAKLSDTEEPESTKKTDLNNYTKHKIQICSNSKSGAYYQSTQPNLESEHCNLIYVCLRSEERRVGNECRSRW